MEGDSTAAQCARDALLRVANQSFADRVEIVESDVRTFTLQSGNAVGSVIFNPPFHDGMASSISPSASRAKAHVLGRDGLDPWFRAAAGLLGTGGAATVIFRADGLDRIIDAARGRFGSLSILPISARHGDPAHRVLVRGVKASRAPLRLLPPLVLHKQAGNDFRPEVEAILRNGAGLATVVPAWGNKRAG